MTSLLRAAVCGLLGLSGSVWAQALECDGPDTSRQGPVTDVSRMTPEPQVDEAFLQRLTLTRPEPPSTEEATPPPEHGDTEDFADVLKQRHSPFVTLRFTSASPCTP
ncbi:hypothetical protein [Myxococcus stipitatus]|uniref:hypothetical protein n=1 Tax=Myxococcus stipitatus TaxID=83455 RepID=UPI0003106CEE|nr:hypothetical protein [Myxococcus stipitatus]